MRWKILGELPFVADVMVNIAVETKPCPAMSSLRPQEDIEQASVLPLSIATPRLMPLVAVITSLFLAFVALFRVGSIGSRWCFWGLGRGGRDS